MARKLIDDLQQRLVNTQRQSRKRAWNYWPYLTEQNLNGQFGAMLGQHRATALASVLTTTVDLDSPPDR